jgi:hypothetical protein
VTGPLRHGRPWGHPATGPPDFEVAGDDADLAVTAARHPHALVRYCPTSSDIARAIGLSPGATGATEVALDALAVESDVQASAMAVNTVIVGRPPDRLRWTTRSPSISVVVDGRQWFADPATTVVVASGQFLRGADIVPRGHPGDGWAEVQAYAVARNERRAMRDRLRSGTHVPHPSITTARARTVAIDVDGRPLPLEVDGHTRARVRRLTVTLVPAAIRVLV